jgi:hypothetical protein
MISKPVASDTLLTRRAEEYPSDYSKDPKSVTLTGYQRKRLVLLLDFQVEVCKSRASFVE